MANLTCLIEKGLNSPVTVAGLFAGAGFNKRLSLKPIDSYALRFGSFFISETIAGGILKKYESILPAFRS
jgi:hypothetical protein